MAAAGAAKKKKAASGWTVFCGELRELLKSEPRKYSNEEVLKECGERWKKLTADEKKIYTIRAQESASVSAAAAAAAGDLPDDDDGGKDDGGEAAGLPLARIKRIVRSDKDVKMVQIDAVKLISKATEMFIEALATGAALEIKKRNRKTLQYADLENHVLKRQRYDFIHEMVVVSRPKEKSNEGKSTEKKSGKSVGANADGSAAPAGPKAITMTAFFKPASAPAAKGKLPGEEDEEEDAPDEAQAAEDEEEENLDDI